ncbi:MAG: class I SAM-dependent methyltransferase [Phycisphaerales bacterium]|nr:MAG: class I SAM-dependent methyltransferase [Phycisphaerales bacterium]
MPRRQRQPVQRYHDRVASRYDASYDDVYWQWHDSLTWHHLKTYVPREHGAETVDLGCGTGKWGLRLLAAGCYVVFVDISMRMLEQAQAKVFAAGVEKRAKFVQADLMDLCELLPDRYELITALGEPIAASRDPRAALRQIRRTLAPGGVLVATFDNKLAALDFYLQQGDAEHLKRFLRDGRTHWLTKDASEQFPIHTHAPSDVRRLLESTGFELLDMIGKTVLPMRHYRDLLAEPADRRALAAIEKSLWRDPAAIGRATHIQVAARRPR